MGVYKFVFTIEADQDVKAAQKYYNDQLPGLGKRFKGEVNLQLQLLRGNPLTRSVRYGKIRFATLKNFPYSINYSVENNCIIVYAVISDYRNPKEYWMFGKDND